MTLSLPDYGNEENGGIEAAAAGTIESNRKPRMKIWALSLLLLLVFAVLAVALPPARWDKEEEGEKSYRRGPPGGSSRKALELLFARSRTSEKSPTQVPYGEREEGEQAAVATQQTPGWTPQESCPTPPNVAVPPSTDECDASVVRPLLCGFDKCLHQSRCWARAYGWDVKLDCTNYDRGDDGARDGALQTQAPTVPVSDEPTEAATPWPPADVASLYEASVNGMTELLRDYQAPPDHYVMDFENMYPAVQDGDFNISSKYFDILEYLSLPSESAVLDYVYIYTGMGGFPFLYLRNQADKRFTTADELFRAKNCSSAWTCTSYLNKVIIDDSPQGFLQFVILDVMGDQFYLFWHDNYNDFRFVTSSTRVEEILQLYPPCKGDGGEEGVIDYGCFSTENAKLARSLNLAPKIKGSHNMVHVAVVLFTEWGGFVERTYNISRVAGVGERIVGSKEEVLVPFDIGIAF